MLAVIDERERWAEDLADRQVDRLCHWIQPKIWEAMHKADQAKKDHEAGLTPEGEVAEFKRGDGHDMRRVLDAHTRRADDGQVVFTPEEETAAAIREMHEISKKAKAPRRVTHAWHLGDGDGKTVGSAPAVMVDPEAARAAVPGQSFQRPSDADFELARRAEELLTRSPESSQAGSILATLIRDGLKGR